MDRKTIQRLISLRQEHGYSQERLAHELNVSRQAISNWERGETAPDTDNLITLAKLYGIGLDALLGIESDSQTPRSGEGAEQGSIAAPTAGPNDITTALPKATQPTGAQASSTGRKHRVALAAALIVAVAAIGISAVAIGAWLKFPGGASSVPQHYEIFGEIVDAEPTYLGVQYVIRGTALRGEETIMTKPVQLSILGKDLDENASNIDALYTVFVSNENTQFLSQRGNKIDNDFLALKKGASAVFTLDVASDTLPALAQADTVRTYDAKGTNLGYAA